MKESTKFSDEYKAKLKLNIKELTRFLEAKTGYGIKMSVQLDKELGYLYAIKLSLDNFETYSKWIIKSTGKDGIKREILESVSHFDFKYKKRGGSTKRITKQIKSSALEIECINCEEKPVGCFHRNNTSPLFKQRGGYCHLCFDCANTRAVEIMRTTEARVAIVFICSIYDRPYIKNLSEKIIAMNLSPVEMFGEYLKRVNLVRSVKDKGSTFASSDIFDGSII